MLCDVPLKGSQAGAWCGGGAPSGQRGRPPDGPLRPPPAPRMPVTVLSIRVCKIKLALVPGGCQSRGAAATPGHTGLRDQPDPMTVDCDTELRLAT